MATICPWTHTAAHTSSSVIDVLIKAKSAVKLLFIAISVLQASVFFIVLLLSCHCCFCVSLSSVIITCRYSPAATCYFRLFVNGISVCWQPRSARRRYMLEQLTLVLLSERVVFRSLCSAKIVYSLAAQKLHFIRF